MSMMKATPFDYDFDQDHIALLCIDMSAISAR